MHIIKFMLKKEEVDDDDDDEMKWNKKEDNKIT